MAKKYATPEDAFQGVEFKDIEGYEGLYAVSVDGRVYSYRHHILLRPEVVHNGYLRVSLCVNGTSAHRRIHRLVAEAYIPNPLDKSQVNHKNGIRTDNRVENLEWVSAKENIQDAIRRNRIGE